FKDAGYATAAFTARAVLAAPTGIGSGFDVYDCPRSDSDRQADGGHVPCEERVRDACRWLEATPRGKPWFLWVHLFEPHAPYVPFAGDAQRGPTRETDPEVARYAGEVRRADAALETLLRAAGPDAIVVLASDHGESLHDHGEPTHGPLCYGSTIDAVLALRAPGFKRGAVDDGLRSVMDIAPTLRRLCRLPQAEGDGKDLGGAPHETLVAVSLFTWWIHGWGQVFSVTDGAHSLVESGGTLELFDLKQDPGETKPIDLSHPAFEKLDRALERFRGRKWGGLGGPALASVPPYGELRRDDRGYLERYGNSALPDPRAHLNEWAAIESVPPLIHLCGIRRDQEPLENALKMLGELESRIPKSPRVDHYRAMLHAAIAHMTGSTARFSDAAWAELAAIENGYVQRETIALAVDYCVAAKDAEALRTLARLLKRSGRRLDIDIERALAAAAREVRTGDEAFYSLR
ncbi:MAG: sulfatase-like hydrolase/transferase, partial [Planctomycetota bacterium]